MRKYYPCYRLVLKIINYSVILKQLFNSVYTLYVKHELLRIIPILPRNNTTVFSAINSYVETKATKGIVFLCFNDRTTSVRANEPIVRCKSDTVLRRRTSRFHCLLHERYQAKLVTWEQKQRVTENHERIVQYSELKVETALILWFTIMTLTTIDNLQYSIHLRLFEN